MAVEAITFDADETLWDFQSVLKRALLDTLERLQQMSPGSLAHVTIQQLSDRRRTIAHQRRGEPHDLIEVRRDSFESILKDHNAPDAEHKADELIARFLDIRFHQLRPYNDARPALIALRDHYRLGLLSNGNSDPALCGLPNLFDAVVLGPEHGFEKPDPRSFLTVARRLGVPIDHIVHVGDGEDDVLGANAAGAISVLLNRTGALEAFHDSAHHEITSLDQLPDLLRSIEQSV